MDFGAFVELEPGVEGLVHISELSHKRVFRTSDVVKEGDRSKRIVQSIDPESKRISLSMKALHQPEPTKQELEAQAEAEAMKDAPADAPASTRTPRPPNRPSRKSPKRKSRSPAD